MNAQIRASGVLSFLGAEADDNEIANFFIESIQDALQGSTE